MFKTGVVERGPFAERTLQLEREHRIWRPFAYTILEQIHENYTPADEPLLERLYQSLSAGSRIKKITRQGRFQDLDTWLVEECSRRFVGVEPLVVHDVGASNGITSLELFERLAHHRRVELHASDYYDRLYLVTLPDRDWTIAFDVDRQPLQAVKGRWVLSLRQPHPWRHPVNRWLQQNVRRQSLPRARSALEKYLDTDVRESANGSECHVRVVSLFHPMCIQFAGGESSFHVGRHDLFQPSAVHSHVIRALNVLTTKHFTSDQVLRGIERIAGSLDADGLLILGRSIDEEDGRLRASAFVLEDSRLSEVWSLHEGYENLDLALKVRISHGSAVGTK